MKTTNANRPVDLQHATYLDIKEGNYTYAVLPWGATEPHNYHLPYLTDAHIGHSIAIEATTKARDRYGALGMVLPTLPLGAQNPGQRELPFCIHTRVETQRRILVDIVESLHHQGIHLLILLNAHGGNNFKPLIRDMAFDHPDTTIVNIDWYSIEPQQPHFDQRDDHAGEMETSVMLHYHPHLVHLPAAGDGASTPFRIEGLNTQVGWVPRRWDRTTRDTGVGDPRHATAEKGRRYVEIVTDKIALLINDLLTKSIY